MTALMSYLCKYCVPMPILTCTNNIHNITHIFIFINVVCFEWNPGWWSSQHFLGFRRVVVCLVTNVVCVCVFNAERIQYQVHTVILTCSSRVVIMVDINEVLNRPASCSIAVALVYTLERYRTFNFDLELSSSTLSI